MTGSNDDSETVVTTAGDTTQDSINTSVSGCTQGSGGSMLLVSVLNLEGREIHTMDGDGNRSSDSDRVRGSDEGLVCDMEPSSFFGNDQELEEEPNLKEDIVDDKEENSCITEG